MRYRVRRSSEFSPSRRSPRRTRGSAASGAHTSLDECRASSSASGRNGPPVQRLRICSRPPPRQLTATESSRPPHLQTLQRRAEVNTRLHRRELSRNGQPSCSTSPTASLSLHCHRIGLSARAQSSASDRAPIHNAFPALASLRWPTSTARDPLARHLAALLSVVRLADVNLPSTSIRRSALRPLVHSIPRSPHSGPPTSKCRCQSARQPGPRSRTTTLQALRINQNGAARARRFMERLAAASRRPTGRRDLLTACRATSSALGAATASSAIGNVAVVLDAADSHVEFL